MEKDQRGNRRASTASRFRNLIRRFHRDRSGSYLVIVALSAPVLVGLVGLGTEDGLWLYTHQSIQSATDAAAFSAAQAYAANGTGGLSLSGGTAGSNVATEPKA